jgi:hypothetical protein
MTLSRYVSGSPEFPIFQNVGKHPPNGTEDPNTQQH